MNKTILINEIEMVMAWLEIYDKTKDEINIRNAYCQLSNLLNELKKED